MTHRPPTHAAVKNLFTQISFKSKMNKKFYFEVHKRSTEVNTIIRSYILLTLTYALFDITYFLNKDFLKREYLWCLTGG